MRAGRQTEIKIPPNLSFHRQIIKVLGLKSDKRRLYKMQLLQKLLDVDVNNLFRFKIELYVGVSNFEVTISKTQSSQ